MNERVIIQWNNSLKCWTILFPKHWTIRDISEFCISLFDNFDIDTNYNIANVGCKDSLARKYFEELYDTKRTET